METVNEQILAFILTIIAGAIVGFLFDFYRVMRGVLQPKRLGTILGDIAFWLVGTVVVFLFLLAGTWGEVRFYVFIGFAAGSLLYRATMSSRAVGCLVYLVRGSSAVARWGFQRVPRRLLNGVISSLGPVRRLGRFIGSAVGRFTGDLVGKVVKFVSVSRSKKK